ncbi:unnamed protein product [Euphydryas editha]|uniref:Uncharacterized protein n=1 Tax=Euphydryas editha TaxID=104508 RepID=A0AAU9TSL1_EUPED|nr:unnamed protein product [Euphydryas editha]
MTTNVFAKDAESCEAKHSQILETVEVTTHSDVQRCAEWQKHFMTNITGFGILLWESNKATWDGKGISLHVVTILWTIWTRFSSKLLLEEGEVVFGLLRAQPVGRV